jgi:hypothetical protein
MTIKLNIAEKKKRGRPVGSKNKSKIDLLQTGGVHIDFEKGSNPKINEKITTGEGIKANTFLKSITNETPVPLPLIGDIKVELPKYVIVPKRGKIGGYKYRLANPTTTARNLSTRFQQKSIDIMRKVIEEPNMVITDPKEQPVLKDFSPADQKKIITYFNEFKSNEGSHVVTEPIIPRGINKNPIKTGGAIIKNPVGRPKKIIKDNLEISVPTIKIKGLLSKHMLMPRRKNVVLDVEGAGIFNKVEDAAKKVKKGATKIGNKIANTAKDISHTFQDVTHKLIHGTNELPPKAVATLKAYGDAIIQSATIIRIPLGAPLSLALNAGSAGTFNERLKDQPYDTLYHLRIDLHTDQGEITCEKNEVINIQKDCPIPAAAESFSVHYVPQGLTLSAAIQATWEGMGNKFLTYSSKDNNCQNFVMGFVNANGMNTPEIEKFTLQDVKPLFTDNFRKLSNSVTQLGAKVAIITQGGSLGSSSHIVQSVLFPISHYTIKTAKKWLHDHGYSAAKVDRTVDMLRFRQHDPEELKEEGYKTFRIKKLGHSGIELIISYSDYNKISGYGIDMPSEIHHHHYYYSHGMGFNEPPSRSPVTDPSLLHGEGIFGKKADKFFKKLGIRDIAYKVGDVLKPVAKVGLDAAITAAAAALVTAQPEFAPFMPAAIIVGTNLANDYMDHPGKYQDAFSSPEKAVKLAKAKMFEFAKIGLSNAASSAASPAEAPTGSGFWDSPYSVDSVLKKAKKATGKGFADKEYSVNSVLKMAKKATGKGFADKEYSVNSVLKMAKKATGKGVKSSKWIDHVKAHAAEHGISYKQAMKEAKDTYNA